MKKITCQILTHNNEKTIERAIKSVNMDDIEVLVGDLRSEDATTEICKNNNIAVIDLHFPTRSDARNYLVSQCTMTDWQMYIEPYEYVKSGIENIKLENDYASFFIAYQKTFSKSVRLWNKKKDYKFINPIFEHLDVPVKNTIDCVVAGGESDYYEYKDIANEWCREKPLLPSAYYYSAMLSLSDKKYNDFIAMSDKYLFFEKGKPLSLAVIRYCRAQVFYDMDSPKKSAEEIQACLSLKQDMAEYWCHLGDIFYFKLFRFEKAKECYVNAITYGSKRDIRDEYPIETSKYKEYPAAMVAACELDLVNKKTYNY
jgi:tetratricopeptide (TPR) repeat protein